MKDDISTGRPGQRWQDNLEEYIHVLRIYSWLRKERNWGVSRFSNDIQCFGKVLISDAQEEE